MAEHNLDYAKLSTEGIKMVLNNDWQQAEELFNAHKDVSVQMSSGYSFVCFLQALMTFEEDKMEAAKTALAETVAHCKNNSSSLKARRSSNKEHLSAEDRLLREVIATDCLLYQAGLVIINQDITSYIKGGWYLRQAWRSYKRLYNEILAFRDDDDPFIVNQPRESSADPEESLSMGESMASTPDDLGDMDLDFGWRRSLSNLSELSRSSKDRLLAAVCFGYGAFQLFISLCPPKVLRLIHFLGFEGDKALGLKCLDFTSQTDGMMAPLATLVLVYYHSVVRPFFALDGPNLCAGILEANRILERASVDYPDSALFLYFRSRVQILEGKTDEALETCRLALSMSTRQRETQHVCLYEIGRLSMMKLQWAESASSFHRLRKESRWARSYYAYLAALSYGSMGDTEKTSQLFIDVPKLVKLKNNQLETFVSKRASRFLENIPTGNQMLVLSLEMLYIWTMIPNCLKDDLQTMLKACVDECNVTFRPLCCLIEGVIYKELDDFASAEKSLKKAIDLHEYDHSIDTHIAAFACFELAMLKGQMGNFQESRQYFLHIKTQYKNYDFEPRLSVKVSAALKRMAEEEVEQSGGGGGGNSPCSIQ